MTELTQRDAFFRGFDAPLARGGGDTPGAKAAARRLGYIRQPGVHSLSFSKLGTLHSCARKYLLREVHSRAELEQSIHLAFGSAFGAGLAELFRTNNLERACVVALSHWSFDDWDNKFVRGKSFWECIHSLELFHTNIMPNLAEEWELAYFNGKPAVELLFYIRVSESYDYQGHIDIILRNKLTGGYAVVECKTASSVQTSAKWQNSEQALGYYYVLRQIQQELNLPAHPETIYITLEVGKWNKSEEDYGFKLFTFAQDEYSEAEFLGSLFSAIHMLDFFAEHNFFPKHGTACSAYGRTCEFFGSCDYLAHLDGAAGTNDGPYEELTLDAADFYIDMTGVHPRADTTA